LEKQGGQVQEKLGELDNFLELLVVPTQAGELESWVVWKGWVPECRKSWANWTIFCTCWWSLHRQVNWKVGKFHLCLAAEAAGFSF